MCCPNMFSASYEKVYAAATAPCVATESFLLRLVSSGRDWETITCCRMNKYFMCCDVCWLNVLCCFQTPAFTSLHPTFPCQNLSQLVQLCKMMYRFPTWISHATETVRFFKHCATWQYFSFHVVCFSSRSTLLCFNEPSVNSEENTIFKYYLPPKKWLPKFKAWKMILPGYKSQNDKVVLSVKMSQGVNDVLHRS